MDYTIPDCPETVHDLLLQKSNGNLYLIVWGERYTGGEDKITISLGETCKQVNIYDPTFATDAVDDYQKCIYYRFITERYPLYLRNQEINI